MYMSVHECTCLYHDLMICICYGRMSFVYYCHALVFYSIDHMHLWYWNSNRGAWHLQRSSFVNSSVYNLSSNVVLLVHRCVLFAFDHMSTSLFQKSDSSNISRIFNASATWETNHLCTSASSNETSKDAGHRLDRADMFPV